MCELKFNDRCRIVWKREKMVIHWSGALGVLEATDLASAIETVLVCRPGRVVVDLSEVEWMGSLALGSLIALRRVVKGYGGTLELRGVNRQVERTLQVAGLDTLFTVSAVHRSLSPVREARPRSA